MEYLRSGVAINAVNMPALSPEQYRTLGPYVALAERLGNFAAYIASGNPRSVRLTYSGRLADYNTNLLRNAGLAGALNRSAYKATLVSVDEPVAEDVLAELRENPAVKLARPVQFRA